MSEVLEGVIRGRTIELKSESGIADGQEVRVTITLHPAIERPDGGEAERKGSAGMLANLSDLDASLDEILADRRREVFREVPE